LAKLRDLDGRGGPESRAVAAMLAASARTVGAYATAAACDGYAALIEEGAPAQARRRALDIIDEEIGIVRAKIADLFPR